MAEEKTEKTEKKNVPAYKSGAQYKALKSYTGRIDGKVRTFTQGRLYKLSAKEYEVLAAAGDVAVKE